MKQQQGFTLIELMIVIAILGILVAIALPAYQDYTVRAKVSEAIAQSAPAKLAVAETAAARGVEATTLSGDDSGFSFPNATRYVKSITIAAGVITVVPQAIGVPESAIPTIKWTPAHAKSGDATSPINWTCSTSPNSSFKYVPAECRKAAATTGGDSGGGSGGSGG